MNEEFVEKFLRESNKIEDVHKKDIDFQKAMKDSWEAYEYLKSQDKIGHEEVKKVHQLILQRLRPEIAGDYKDCYNWVNLSGKKVKVFCPPEKVESKLEKLFAWKPETKEEAFEWKKLFVNIHCFADGNGRVSRLVYLWICTELSEVEPEIFTYRNRQDYYDCLNGFDDCRIDPEIEIKKRVEWIRELN